MSAIYVLYRDPPLAHLRLFAETDAIKLNTGYTVYEVSAMQITQARSFYSWARTSVHIEQMLFRIIGLYIIFDKASDQLI